MKGYRDYMDKIAADAELHARIMGKINNPVRRRFPIQGYLAAACVVVALSIALAYRHLPAGPHPAALSFNRAAGAADAAKSYLPGYFTQELTRDELLGLFGGAQPLNWPEYTVEASAGFSGTGVLDTVTIICTDKTTGQRISLLLADSLSSIPDYLYPDPPVSSEVGGISVLAGCWPNPATGEATYYGSFTLGETAYYIESTGDEQAKAELTGLVNRLAGGPAANLSQITPTAIPQWREEELTLAQAQADPEFGAYVPRRVPSGFVLQTARRSISQNRDDLSVNYENGMRYIFLTIERKSEATGALTADLRRPETYDLSLYPIPRAASVPAELRAIVDNPVFAVEDLTLEAVRARAYQIDDAGDDNTGYRMRFSVLFGAVVVEFNIKGAWPEEIFELVKTIGGER